MQTLYRQINIRSCIFSNGFVDHMLCLEHSMLIHCCPLLVFRQARLKDCSNFHTWSSEFESDLENTQKSDF